MKRESINELAQLLCLEKLEQLYKQVDATHELKVLTAPTEQTLLVPVKDPISQGSFYAGEVLVTSTIVQVNGVKGWSMVMDSNETLSLYTATLDACFEANIFKDEIISLLQEAHKGAQQQREELNQKVNSTRVSFDLM